MSLKASGNIEITCNGVILNAVRVLKFGNSILQNGLTSEETGCVERQRDLID